jgi:hypothetical protein
MEKFSQHIFNRTLRNVKNHVGNGYQHLKRIAHTVHHGFTIAKQAYAIVEPVIRHIAGNNHIHQHAMKAIGGYENLRDKVVEANHHVVNAGHKLGGLV